MKGHGGLVMRHGLQKIAEDPGSSKLEGWGALVSKLRTPTGRLSTSCR